MRTLEEHGIRSIDLTPNKDNAKIYEDGTRLDSTVEFTREDGSKGTAGDVALSYQSGEADGFDDYYTQRFESTEEDEQFSGMSYADVFVFKANFGKDVVYGFNAGDEYDDVIQLDQDVFADFEAVSAAAHQVGDDVVIAVDETNTITLKNVTLSQLNVDDFRFAA